MQMMNGDQVLSLAGERQHGQDVRSANVTAVMAVANILKSSLGPQGLDKMLVDEIGDVTVTNDGATILQKLELEHPAAKVLQELSRLQDQEVGDGTTSVVLVAAELLKRANDMIKAQEIHPTSIIHGYRLAMKEALKFIQGHLVYKASSLPDDVYLQVARTSLSSKFVDSEGDKFAQLVVEAIKSVKTSDGKFPVANVNILKSHGKSCLESQLITKGYAIGLGRAAQGMPTVVRNAKIALLDFDLKKHRMALGVQIQISDPTELEKVRQKEMDITKQRINTILANGVNVIFTSRGVDDMSLKYLIDRGVFAVRRVDKKDLKRIAKSTGAKILLTLTEGTADGDGWEIEGMDATAVGHADEVCEERVGDNDFTFVRGTGNTVDHQHLSNTSTFLLRGANEVVLDESHRSVHDALCAVSKAMESSSLVPGAGAVEAALAVHLEDYGTREVRGREQMAILAFADALLVIPKTLAANAALDVTEIVAKLKAKKTIEKDTDEGKGAGLDLLNGTIFNALKGGVVEPAMSKLKSIKFATEAAITILRIDDLIKLSPEPEAQQ